jgi:hypothetical protein
LIAFDWIEQNTGEARLGSDGTLAACYRVTRHGLQEFRRLSGIESVEDSPEPPEQSQPRFARKKKAKAESPGVVASE